MLPSLSLFSALLAVAAVVVFLLSILRQNSPFRMSAVGVLVALCWFSTARSEARADIKGVPYSEQFKTAQFPYAHVAQTCDDWRKPERFADDQFGDVSFSGACVEHDRCFHTLGMSWGACNERFRDDLHAACARDIKRADLELGLHKAPDGQALKMCEQVAALFLARVQVKESPRHFEDAQAHQRSYLQYVRGVIDTTYRSALRRKATKTEQFKALKALAREWTLDDLKASLMGAKIDEAEGLTPAVAAQEENIE